MRYHPDMDGLKKTTKDLCEDSWLLDQKLNQAYPEYKSRALMLNLPDC
jgi:hypothetical protein